ncbi:MAG: TonB-dependent siderophore receptor [Hydrogenophaga sp.]|nr:TonB-dependent siderophore receptor [Hydrogenophaga sp.]MDP2404662.1 TonB-dependent siderophore receptor [Hydrogenophaga sp.]MDZ4174986.1 TonB-dependent siderophore receptor [Hydrogenophaga sp.]
MSQRKKSLRSAQRSLPRYSTSASTGVMLPLGAMLLAGSMNAMAQTAPAGAEKTLPTVVVREQAEAPEGKDALRATETRIGKGQQQLRDIPQSVTVVTEKLIDDRNLDTVKEALKNTAGITFLAAEGGEEDIRLRGFALQATGDLFIDGMRDPAIYDRDTFNLDRMEVLRGSASMMFGRGSTGGAVNQVSKTPRLIDEHQIDLTLGNHKYVRATGDFNIQTGESAALRINAMATKADNNGSGASLDKRGAALAYRNGIGERNEFQVNLYHLDNNNGINYGMPFIAPTTGSSDRVLLPLKPDTYYGAASDYNDSSATLIGGSHTHRFSRDSELRTQIRVGQFERDQRSGAIRLCTRGVNQETGAVTNPQCPSTNSLENFGPNTVLTRGNHLKIQDMDTAQFQSDYSGKFEALGVKHDLLAGIDFSREERTVYAARSRAQGGVDISKPTTLVGTPDDGAWVDESSRVLRVNNQYTAQGWGAYVQDTVEIAPAWKVVAGLRYDNLTGDYDSFSLPQNAAGPMSTERYRMEVSEWSPRAGVLFQPTPQQSYHFSVGQSFNTSGDAYSLGASNVNTPPEKSRNIELGAKLDSADKRFSTRLAVFRSTKYNERNTDPDRPVVTLSGERHVAGFEADIMGRLTSKWEVFGSYMWLPVAKVDRAAPCPTTGQCAQGAAGERPGDRPSLTPEHSGTVWTTYQFTPKLRLGAGLNFRGKQSPTRVEWTVPSYVTADLMAEYRFDFDRLTLKANLSNIADKLYADQLYPGHYIPGAGRTLQVTASLKF